MPKSTNSGSNLQPVHSTTPSKSSSSSTQGDIQMSGDIQSEQQSIQENFRQPSSEPADGESIFHRALRAKNDRVGDATTRVTKVPSRIKPTSKIKGWFRVHRHFFLPAIYIFDPKDDGGFSDEPIFIMPDLAEELRSESSQFENAIKEVSGHLVCTMSGALYLVLVPLPDPTTGRLHPANEQKLDALEQARFEWKRLDWNKDVKQYDDYTAHGITTEPKWPDDVSPASILGRAFGERNVIKDRDDPLLVKFRGEA